MTLKMECKWLFWLVVTSLFATCSFQDTKALPDCSNNDLDNDRFIFVSTLDGSLTALNSKDGMVVWSVKVGEELLSSTIQKLELTNNGRWVRMIPSLSGGIYRFDGESVDITPITVDQLLTLSFKLSDDLVFAGAKKTNTYGISKRTGQILYECNVKGCKNRTYEDTTHLMADGVIILQEHMQTVHAVDPQTGNERWNFSVGTHDIKLSGGTQCHDKSVLDDDFNIVAIIPEAVVYTVSKNNPSIVQWKRKLSSPIANVWKTENNALQPVDLFSGSQWTWRLPGHKPGMSYSPAVYIGMHKKQLYIHESATMRRSIAMYFSELHTLDNDAVPKTRVPRIPWKPYPALSSAVSIKSIAQEVQKESSISSVQVVEQKTTSLSVLYASEYINGNGFYLYTEENISQSQREECNKFNFTFNLHDDSEGDNMSDFDLDDENSPIQVIVVSLWYWWKEVLIISITTAFVVNIICAHNFFHYNAENAVRQEIVIVERHVEVPIKPKETRVMIRSSSESQSTNDFNSRFLNDFEIVHCLGRGGFGVVFETKNKIDDCNYAIKRIDLPNRELARDRVMREVRALAKLDHCNIVRYFNAWLEYPPSGWKEQHDKVWFGDFSVFSDVTLSQSAPISKCKEVNVDLVMSDDKLESDSDSCVVFEHSTPTTDSVKITIDKNDNDQKGTLGQSELSSIAFLSNSSKLGHRRGNSLHISRESNRMLLYIQMQLCKRESLRDWMQINIDRTKDDIKGIFKQIVDAVEYVHMQGLIHRDLKPSNIFFSLDNQIKVGDFGLVTDMADDIPDVDQEGTPKCQYKRTCDVGTHLYMSPEQREGLSYNYKVDIYSLGIIYFELLVPFGTESERFKKIDELKKNEYPYNFETRYKKEFDLLQMMLSRNPEKRPTTLGIRAQHPLLDETDCRYHYDLPPRVLRRDSQP